MTTFNATTWAERFRAARERAERYAEVKNTATTEAIIECMAELLKLYGELCRQLGEVTLTQADYFDRPQLVLVLSAAYQATGKPGKGGLL